MPGVGAQCPWSPGGEEQEGLRGAETPTPTSQVRQDGAERLRGAKPGLCPQSRQHRKQNRGKNKRLKRAQKLEAVGSGLQQSRPPECCRGNTPRSSLYPTWVGVITQGLEGPL